MAQCNQDRLQGQQRNSRDRNVRAWADTLIGAQMIRTSCATAVQGELYAVKREERTPCWGMARLAIIYCKPGHVPTARGQLLVQFVHDLTGCS
jgi:hypothetical protein